MHGHLHFDREKAENQAGLLRQREGSFAEICVKNGETMSHHAR